MLIEVKVKVARIIDGKTRKRSETYVVDKEVFAEAELLVMTELTNQKTLSVIEDFDIQSLRQSTLKEVATQFSGDCTFIATLKDIFLDNDGNEKATRYKVLLWANDLTEANTNVRQLAKQGYDLQIEGIKQVEYDLIKGNVTQEDNDNGNN